MLLPTPAHLYNSTDNATPSPSQPQVLYLDSDSTPLLDPAALFGAEQYRRHGNLYWADFYAG